MGGADMTRLARHDEIVERMAEQIAVAIYAEDVRAAEAYTPAVHRPARWANPLTDMGMARQKSKLLAEGHVYATTALDALLTAVVELGVARKGFGWPFDDGQHWEADTVPQRDGTDFPALILQLEDKP
jgi:hypothetical protein